MCIRDRQWCDYKINRVCKPKHCWVAHASHSNARASLCVQILPNHSYTNGINVHRIIRFHTFSYIKANNSDIVLPVKPHSWHWYIFRQSKHWCQLYASTSWMIAQLTISCNEIYDSNGNLSFNAILTIIWGTPVAHTLIWIICCGHMSLIHWSGYHFGDA